MTQQVGSRAAALPAAIGPYEVVKLLGSGAFGDVYLARHPVLERDVALKILRSLSDQAVQRFLREAKVLAKMDHPNIVRVYDAGQHEKNYYLASAFIAGRDLNAFVQMGGMEPRRAVRLIVQLLEALAYAHERGVLHRDVKPANAMVDDKDHLYLMDFGLAGLAGLGDEGGARMTHDGAVMGTPSFMSPEQAAGKTQEIGPAADLYSAGVALYQVLTGRLPFEEPFPLVVYHVVNTVPPPPSRFRPDLSPVLEKICLKALAKNPAERFASGREFADALQKWLKQPATASRQPAPPPVPAPPVAPQSATVAPQNTVESAPQPRTRPKPVAKAEPAVPPPPEKSRTGLFIVLAVLAVAVLGAGVFVSLRAQRGQPKSRQQQLIESKQKKK